MSQMPAMYIFVNCDYEMSKGSIAAQCCHITNIITEEIIRNSYESFPPQESYFTYVKWSKEPTTIILKATTEQLNQLKNNKNARYFIDNGNRLPNDALTVVGFYPSNCMSELVKDFKLL